MYDHNSCVDVLSEFMCKCIVTVHVLMYDHNPCVNV